MRGFDKWVAPARKARNAAIDIISKYNILDWGFAAPYAFDTFHDREVCILRMRSLRR